MQTTQTNTVTPPALQSIKNPRWLNLVRRLEQLAMSQNGHAIINISVVVDKNGMPLAWIQKMALIEPKDGSQAFLDILSNL